MPRFAANLTMMFNEVDFLARFDAAAAASFSAVEYLFPYEHPAEVVAERLAAAGLKQALFNLPPGDWARGDRGMAALPDRQAEFRRSVHTAVEYGRIIGTPTLHMMAGIADRTDQAAVESYRDAVSFCAEALGQEGMALVLEPINRRDMPGYFLNDFEWACDFIAGLGLSNLKLQFDIYHRQIMHGDVTMALKALMPLIGHVQIASVPLRNEPGTGELDDFRLMSLLDTLGYEGYVGCEYRPAAGTVEGLGWLSHVAHLTDTHSR